VHFIRQNIEKVAAFSRTCIQQEDEKIKNINAINQELTHISNNQAIQKRLSGYDEDLCRHRSRKVLCQSLKLTTQNTLKLSEDAIMEYRNHISFSTPSFSESINLYKLGSLDFSHITSIKQFLNLDFFSADQLKRLKVVFEFGLCLGGILFLFLNTVNKKISQYMLNRFIHVLKYFMLLLLPLILVLAKCSQYFTHLTHKAKLTTHVF
jgi:hypothetical protein